MKQQLRTLTLMLAGLAMLGPFSIDTYLPSFAAISRDFGVSPLVGRGCMQGHPLKRSKLDTRQAS